MDESALKQNDDEIVDEAANEKNDFRSLPVCNSLENPSLLKIPPAIETILTSVQMKHKKSTIVNQTSTLKVSPKRLMTRSKQKYRLIRKSPLKGSPVKSITHILHKHKKKKSKGLSPRKLQFILPKVRKRKSQRSLRSKSLPTLPNSKLRMQENQSCEQSTDTSFQDNLRGASSDVGDQLFTMPEQPSGLDLLPEESSSLLPQEENATKSVPQGSSRCEEDNEEENEEEETEMQQQKEHLAAFLKASSTIAPGQRSGERRGGSGIPREQQKLTKQQRRLQDKISALSLVLDLKSQQDALVFSYVMRVKEALTAVSSKAFDNFVDVLNGIVTRGDSVERVFFDVMEILKGFPDLQAGFVMFLRPDQAIRVGKYAEFCLARRLREFVYELKHHFSRQPQNLQKVSRTLQTLLGQEHVTSEQLVATLTPVLKLQPLLLESLSQIFPWSKPQQILPGDFEEISLDDTGSESPESFGFEHINLIDDDAKPPSESCPCNCHKPPPSQPSPASTPSPVMKLDHCISCALRFIDGRVFVLSGRSLRPAKVTLVKSVIPQGEMGKETPNLSSISKDKENRGPPSRSTLKQQPCSVDKGSKTTTKSAAPKTSSESVAEGEKPKKGRKTRKT